MSKQSELSDILSDFADGVTAEEAWVDAKQAITDWHNKQIEEVLDRLEQVHRANPLWVNMTQRVIPLSAIEAERNSLGVTNDKNS